MPSTPRRELSSRVRPAQNGKGVARAGVRALTRRIAGHTATVGVIGQGYVGFPLAQRTAACGFAVIGYDIDSAVAERCAAESRHARYHATASLDELRACDVLIVAVPTPTRDGWLGPEPDLHCVLDVARGLGVSILSDGKPRLVVLESTYAPGTTRGLVAPLLASGCALGETLWLGYSPERIDPGNRQHTLANTPKIVSGDSAAAAELTRQFYAQIVSHVELASSLEAAELTKLTENVFRFISITSVQEIDELCVRLRLDTREIIRLAATKPFGFMPFSAGAGIGGHCIAEDPYFLERAMRDSGMQPAILQAALANHEGRAAVIVARIARELPDESLSGRRLLLLGVSYKPDVDDTRRSPALPVLRLLEQAGAIVDYHDPLVPIFAGRASIDLAAVHASDYDLAVVITAHTSVDLQALAVAGWSLYDTRGVSPQQVAALQPAPSSMPAVPAASPRVLAFAL
jgi:UDP-N-acetyl-D-glucosamine dehydrogenase